MRLAVEYTAAALAAAIACALTAWLAVRWYERRLDTTAGTEEL